MTRCKPFRRWALATAATLATAAWAAPARADFTGVQVVNLVTDDQAANPAQLTDPSLVNAWGISASPASPFWVSNNGTGTSTLYRVDANTNAVTKVALTVTIPGDGSVTGQVSNVAGGFNNDNFLFVSEDGTVSGWRGALGTAAERFAVGSPMNVYKGVTEAVVGGHTYLYAANFRSGTIDVLKGDTNAPTLPGSFVDPTLPAGYAPFNIQKVGNTLYVTYALTDATHHDDVPGAGHGFVSRFDLNGNFIDRFASAGTLDSPWGMAIAPSTFGPFAGALLVGNFGDGLINAFDPNTRAFLDQLRDSSGQLIRIGGLWGLIVGNSATGGPAGSSNKLYFTAGPSDEMNGLFGVIQAVPEPSSFFLLLVGSAAGLALARRRPAPAPPSA